MNRVPRGLYWKTRLVAATEGLWRRLGNLESSVLRDEIESVAIDRPVYVTSLARSGTTIVTELLNEHPQTTSHRYADFPVTWTPYWRNWLATRSKVAAAKAVERAHNDRIMVTNDSPEAIEEVLWMHFFEQLHNPALDQTALQRNSEFDAFYRDHIRKLLLVRQSQRYVAKGNYNISRINYIRGLFPDARFIVPVRDPVWHIASLQKQHALFSRDQEADARIRWQLGRSGHFEFGLDRTPIHLGDNDEVSRILRDWSSPETEIEGWARYWAMVYGYVANHYLEDPSILIVRYEDLCSDSESVVHSILEHADLDPQAMADTIADYAARLQPPDYYHPPFTDRERERIHEITRPVAERFYR